MFFGRVTIAAALGLALGYGYLQAEGVFNPLSPLHPPCVAGARFCDI